MSVTSDKLTYREILIIALPMVASQASETTMFFFDRLFLSRVNITVMSAALSGGISNFVFQSFFIGLIGYINALVAQFYGAGKLQHGRKTLSQGIILSFIAWPIIVAAIPIVRLTFILAGHTPEQIAYEYLYVRILMAGSIFTLLRTAFGSYFIGIGKTNLVFIANVIGVFINIPLNYVLIFGKFGFPALGLRGAAYATLFSIIIINGILFIFYLCSHGYKMNKHNRLWSFDKEIFIKLIKFGAPAGGNLFLNIMAFNIGLQLLHSYGAEVAAAVTITLNYDQVVFIPMAGLGAATTSIVGRYMGAKKPQIARKAGFMSWKISLFYGGIMMLIFLFGAEALVNLFAAQFKDVGDEYLKLSRTMLRLASIYILADMTQLIFACALRGAGDTHWVMRVSVLIHWFYAISVIVFVRLVKIPPISTWLLFIVFVICLGCAMSSRYIKGKWQSISVIDHN